MPLHIASRKGYVEVVELLIRYGAVPDIPNKVSWIAIHTYIAIQNFLCLILT